MSEYIAPGPTDDAHGINSAAPLQRRVPHAFRYLSTTIGTSLAIQAVTLGSGILLARSLGPDSRGELAIAMLWPTILVAIGGIGIAEASVYFAGKEATQPSATLSNALLLGAVQSLALVILGYYLLPLILAGRPSALVREAEFYLWVMPVTLITLYALSIVQGRADAWAFNLSRLSVHILYTAMIIGLALFHLVNVRFALLASILASVGAGLLTWGFVVSKRYVTVNVSAQLLRRLLFFGGRLHVGNLATLAVSRLDVAAVAFTSSSTMVGEYVVALSVGMAAGVVPAAVSFVLLPMFGRQNEVENQRTLRRFLFLAGTGTLLGAPILLIALPKALPVVFGPKFEGAAGVATILIIANIARGWNVMFTSILRGAHRPGQASVGELIGLVVLVALLVVLAPRFGNVGVATAVAVAAFAAFCWLVRLTLALGGLGVRDVPAVISSETMNFLSSLSRRR